MIYILEGPDGTGKTTLANKIAEYKKASVLHSYFDKSWDIYEHHKDVMNAAFNLEKWRPVVVDRWVDSETVYGSVFRGKPGYDTFAYIDFVLNLARVGDSGPMPVAPEMVWIYCRNDNAVKNHLKNMEKRNEMFDDMTKVVDEFDKLIKNDPHNRKWIVYDFNKVKVRDFVKELPGENFVN